MEKLKVLVVDDSSLYKKILTQAVEGTGLGSVVHTASNGILALERLKQRKMDVVLLKVFMPEMNGTEVLAAIKKDYPDVFVIMVSSGGADSASSTINALQMGALDFILKPLEANPEKSIINVKNQLQGLFTQIITIKYTSGIHSATARTEPRAAPAVRQPAPVRKAGTKVISGADLVVIAASTGGPVALETICSNLPANFDRAVLVVQHMPAEFTRKLAQWMDKKCPLTVVEAVEGQLIKPGQVIIAPGGLHMAVDKKGPNRVIRLENTLPRNGVKPAADVLFSSVAAAYRGDRILSVILTGMGGDGTLGVGEMKKACHCYCLAQSESTCVVYGMPQSVVNAGLADEVQDLEAIPSRIVQIVKGRGM